MLTIAASSAGAAAAALSSWSALRHSPPSHPTGPCTATEGSALRWRTAAHRLHARWCQSLAFTTASCGGSGSFFQPKYFAYLLHIERGQLVGHQPVHIRHTASHPASQSDGRGQTVGQATGYSAARGSTQHARSQAAPTR